MSDVVLTMDSVDPSTINDYNSAQIAQIQELNDVKEFLKLHHNKYVKYKILHDAVEEYITSPNNPDDIKMKVKDIILGHSCAQVIPIENEGFNQASSKLLGISNLQDTKLNYLENMKLRKSLQLILQEKYKNICKQFSNVTKQDINEIQSLSSDFLNFNLTADDYTLLEFQKKLVDQQQQYLQNLLKEQEILEDFTKLRLEKLPRICNEKIKECQIKSDMNALRTNIVKEKTRVDIFTETNNSLRAYEEIMKDIKEQQIEHQNEIDHLHKLKEKYNQVACKQFSEILKSYTQYKSAIEKKKMIYDAIKN